jgi:hypothetical protein
LRGLVGKKATKVKEVDRFNAAAVEKATQAEK